MATLDSLQTDTGLAFNNSRPKAVTSWGAIIAGALVAIATTLILFSLGSGLGFASISPWSGHGVTSTGFTIEAAIWLIVMQWVSASLGGYIVGRLRTRWIGTHLHEIFFRDTAHGLVTWALATVVVAVVLASSVSAGIGGGVKAVSSVASAGAQGAAQGAVAAAPGAMSGGGMSGPGGGSALSYGIDKLFRPGSSGGAGMSAASSGGAGTSGGSGAMSGAAMTGGPNAMSGPSGPNAGGGGGPGANDMRAEATRILANAAVTGSVPDADRTYLVSMVAARTGISQTEAQQRVDDLIASANEAQAKVKAEADAARKDAAEIGIYTALSMLIGAFIASVSAALGGRLRDEHV